MKAADSYHIKCQDCERVDTFFASQSTALLTCESHIQYWPDHWVTITRVTLCTSEEK
jgi:hypothetical protein